MKSSSASKSSDVTATLLMVDDNKMGLGARRVVMEEHGYTVLAAATPEEALSLLDGSGIDLVITTVSASPPVARTTGTVP